MTDSQPQAAVKHDFSDMYNQPSPTAYVSAMLALDYREPDFLPSVALELLHFVEAHIPSPASVTVLDVCCGYGMNAAWLKEGVSGGDMFRRIQSGAATIATAETPLSRPVRVIGMDIAENALAYAEGLGLHDGSVSTNLEMTDPTPEERALISETNVILSTGSLSYISAATVNRILEAIPPERALLAAFWPIIGTDTSAIQDAMTAHGLTVSEDPKLHLQRKFANTDEQARYLKRYADMGVDTAGTPLAEGLAVTTLLARRNPR